MLNLGTEGTLGNQGCWICRFWGAGKLERDLICRETCYKEHGVFLYIEFSKIIRVGQYLTESDLSIDFSNAVSLVKNNGN